MKKVLLTIVTMLLPLMASADAVEIDGIWYNLINKVKEAEVTKNPNGNYSGSIDIPASVTYNEVNYSVTLIGESAFAFCGITSVNIPNSVKSIGNEAFSVCTKLASIIIPNYVTSIGVGAFRYCTDLTSVTIGNSVSNIGEDAFCGCSGLTSITIPKSVTSIGVRSFGSCNGLTSVTIPNSVTSIGDGAFEYCSNLTSITIPYNVTSIGYFTFSGCSSLTSITIPNNVTSIQNNAFSGCSGLTKITIGNGAKLISENAFAQCPELTDVFCMAEELSSNNNWGSGPLYTNTSAFVGSYVEFATLHVPETAINAYKTTEPWSGFGNFVSFSGEGAEMKKCATPTISIEGGTLKFSCETEGAEFVSIVSTTDTKEYYDAEFTLAYKYKVTVFATKAGYENSDTTVREIVITENGKAVLVGDVDGNGVVNVADHVELSKIIMNKEQ